MEVKSFDLRFKRVVVSLLTVILLCPYFEVAVSAMDAGGFAEQITETAEEAQQEETIEDIEEEQEDIAGIIEEETDEDTPEMFDITDTALLTRYTPQEELFGCDVLSVITPAGADFDDRRMTIDYSVSNSTDSLEIDVEISEGASWALYSGVTCLDEISDNTAELSDGINRAYIKVTSGNGRMYNLYEVTITRGAVTTRMRAEFETSRTRGAQINRASASAACGCASVGYNEAAFEDGGGTSSAPYEIWTAEQLNHLRAHLGANTYFILMDDIDLTGFDSVSFGSKWEPIGLYSVYGYAFQGKFDGNNKTITGLSSTKSTDNVGLFGYAFDAEIKNTKLADVNINVSVYYVGGIVGRTNGNTLINACQILSGDIEGGRYVGGIAGESKSTVTITGCHNAGLVIGNGSYIAGGIAGINNGSTIINSYNTGTVTGVSNVGGIVGDNNNGTITNCHNKSVVIGSGNLVGGIAGGNANGGIITNCYNTGAMKGVSNVGGIVGANGFGGTTTNSYNTGAVSGSKYYTGGVAGINNTIIANCYNTGAVTNGDEGAGGVSGYNSDTISKCYNTGAVFGISYVGGVVGEDDDTVVYCYYDSDNCAAGGIDGVDAAGSAVGKTTAQMMKEATYVNWDFVNTWDIDEDVSYPFLIGLPNPYDPGSSDPEIVVAAAFPNGATEQFAVDITYTATPSSGEDVSEVYYSVNGGTEEYIYLRGGSGISARGTLGAGRVFLKPGVNNIVFTVKDTAGKTGTYAVANTPDSYWGYDPPPIDPQYIEQSPTFSKNRYVTNRLIIDGTLEATETEILNVISSINGTVIGKVNLTKTYMIEIPVNNEAGLQAICDGLMTNYPDIVRLATLDVMRDYVLPGDKDTGGSEQGSETDKHKQETAKAPKAGSFFFRGYNSGGVGGGIFKTQEELNGLNRQIIAGTGTKYTEDPWWEEQDAQTGKYAQWGLEAIKVPQAWIGYSSFFRGVNIGIVDGGIRETHEDLKDDTGNQIPAENIVDFGQSDKKHGTRVMGVISAEHGNGKGLAGVIDASRNSLYAYDCFGSGTTDYRITNGLIWNVQHGAKVVNFSVLVDYEVEAGDTNPRYSSTMDYLLSLGYDFVVVQAAGNEEIDAANVGAFSFVTEPELRKRIITVGAANEDGGMWRQNGLPIQGSNYGSIVDLVAPGVRIYSTEANSNDDYGFGGGTSIAAPHVTGVAAMVWSANPGLTGKQVKKIIKDSADTANPIIDNRAGVPAGTYYLIDAQAAVSMAVNETQALEEGTLIGTVVESNINETPIANAIVELYSVSSGLLIDTALTGLGGGYVMDDIEPGQYIIEVSKEGFIKKSFSMQINAGVNVYIHRISAITGTGWFYNLVAENSPDLAHIICMAEEIKNGTGYGSNGRFLALVGAPDPGATPIYTAQDLDDVRNDLTGSYVLMNNIDLSGWGEWDPIGDYFDPFTGTFDGQGHTINDLTITAFDYSAYTYGFAGLFGYMDNGNIKNVGMADTMIDLYYYPTTNPTGKYFAGAVCGGGGGEISNCYNTGSVYSNSAAAGITAGGLDESAAIRDCYNTGPASARLGVQAGICAYPSVMDISNCVNTGNISGVGYAGGIVSGCGSWTYISNCYNTGSITAAGPYAGGIVGHNMSGDSVTDCYNAGDISSGGYTGGIVGKAAITGGRTITKCYNSGSVYSYSTLIGSAGTDGAYSGGICGHVTYGEVRGCYNIGDITSEGAHTFAGGVSGFGDIGRISSCHNFGKIFSNSASYHAYAGGIIGCFGAGTSTVKDITGCHNEGPVIAGSCYNFAGGICGYIGGNFPSGLRTVNDCYNTGDITADYGTSYVGGISGYMANFNNIIYAPQINNCYNIGKLIASGLAGGISGSGNGYTEINNCAALGDEINAPTYSSYMIGYGVSKKTNNLAIDGVIIGNPINDATARITQQQAKQQATYETLGWDFNTVWEINNGYPTLQPVVGSRSVSVIDNNDFTDRAPNNLRDWILETERLTNTFLEDVSGIAQR